MTSTDTWHRLSDIDPVAQTGSCAQCGPVRVLYRVDRQQWRCAIQKRRLNGKRPGPTSYRAWRLRTRYDMTPAEYDQILQEQGGTCALCNLSDEPDGRRLAVDHDHATGRVRGLLCGACNRGLGLFRDDPQLLARAALYLSRT